MRHINPTFSFTRAAVLVSSLMLTSTAGLMGQPSAVDHTSMPVAAMAKPGTRVSAGKVLLRVDNVSSSEVYMSLFGPDGVASKVEPLPIDVWKRYRLGRTEFYVKATTDGAGKDVFFSFLF